MRHCSRLFVIFCATITTALLHGCATQIEPTPQSLQLQKIGGFEHQTPDKKPALAEIPAYDRLSKRLFIVTGTTNSVDVLSLADPSRPSLLGSIASSAIGPALGSINSADIHNGILALAIESEPRTDYGTVAFLRASDLRVIGKVTVGANPDMLKFTPDGKYLLVANEGEASEQDVQPMVNPEGSVSIITLPPLSPDISAIHATVDTADFRAFNGQAASLRAAGVRLFGPNAATVAEDLEPEYIAISSDSSTAYVTLQENNAIAILDVASRKFTAIKPLGYKDHAKPGNGFDASDQDQRVNIQPWPVKGIYMPDEIASFRIGNATYLITSNEGDSREAFHKEEIRVGSHCRPDDPVFGGDASLHGDHKLGRLIVTLLPNGGVTGKDAQGRCTELYSFGGRSFSIWDANVNLLWDSGSQLEEITAAESAKPDAAFKFNTSNSNNTEENRSPAKGPEPEGVTVAKFGDKTYAFIGLERVGGVVVYDVSNPRAPVYVTYLNTRSGEKGDNGPEGLLLIPAADSPNRKPLLIVANETSGTTAILQINLSY
jgi:DNA-binding beta-propeller fold protein YncE